MVTNELTTSNKNESRLGVVSFLLAIVAAGSVTMIGVTSFTPFNPPGWLRIITMAPLPFLLILSVGFGIAGLKSSAGRVWAMLGLLTAISVVVFIVMINAGG